MSNEFDTMVIGAGIAGLTAGLVSARLGRTTLVLTGDVLGGQLLSIEKIEGFPGYADDIAGYDLCPLTQEQAARAGAAVAMASASRLEPSGDAWQIGTSSGDYTARAVIVATGTVGKELSVPGEALLRGKGVSHCASCDAPLLRGREVVTVGGGDSSLQEALTLAQHASRVTILHHGDDLTAQATFRERVAARPEIALRPNTEVLEILGDRAVEGVRVRDLIGGTTEVLETAAVFVYIGLKPNAALMNGRVSLDRSGRIPVDAAMRTRLRGVFAAGTVRSGTAGRAVAAAGDGANAAVAADRFLRDGMWPDQK
ncbi:MAG TPA: FAD-dependent oxidoreductase [Gammaproteobacteria bacterium]